ncbi:acetylglutamate kinase [Streptomyces albus]|uniref:acetylglutamate kinase n=1 Tax=Streptomyces albus TaxID=1888 RepID=UPI0033E27C11
MRLETHQEGKPATAAHAPGTNRPAADIVVKAGGAVLAEPVARAALAADIIALHRASTRTVVVHGGGPQITEYLGRLGVPAQFVDGQRVTSSEALDVVRMVLTGRVQRELVGDLNRHGPYAVGISGEDGRLLGARRRGGGLGEVGDVTRVDTGLIDALLAAGRIPVVSSLAVADDGAVLNINADAAAAAVAVAAGARRLVLLTDVAGICADWPRDSMPIPRLSADRLAAMSDGLTAGMRPKADACLAALRGGVARVQVTDGRRPHAVLEAAVSDRPPGTSVVAVD